MGVPTPYLVGLGALNGSGVMHPGRSFNLQGAMMGGAMAYGASQLASYARGASDAALEGASKGAVETVEAAKNAVPPAIEIDPNIANASGSGVPNIQNVPQPSAYSSLGSSTLTQPIGAPMANPTLSANGLSPYAGNVTPIGMGGVPQPGPGILDRIGTSIANAPGNAAEYISNIPGRVAESASNAYDSAAKFADKATNLDTYTNALDKGITNAGKTASGIGNLLSGGQSVIPAGAVGAGTAASFPYVPAAATLYGAMGLKSLDEQKKYLNEALAANTISQEEYDKAMAEVNRSVQDAKTAVSEHPWNANPDVGGSLSGSGTDNPESWRTAYSPNEKANTRLYAVGGMVNTPSMINPPDDQTGMPSQSPLSSDFGMSGLSNLSNLLKGYSASGMTPAKGYDFEGGGYGGQLAQQAPSQSAINAMTASGQYNPQGNSLPAPYTNGTSGTSGSGMSGGLGSLSGQGSNAFPLQGQYGIVKMAQGGLAPRFLSGGGDGMSDSIPANIGGHQEARLADGEFVVPADVVSHLGNGSSKAGAKQLYSMMDRVRTARTGRKSQGKQINPRKYMAA
jgi:hypothetical protein